MDGPRHQELGYAADDARMLLLTCTTKIIAYFDDHNMNMVARSFRIQGYTLTLLSLISRVVHSSNLHTDSLVGQD